jgi:hypothetical protein
MRRLFVPVLILGSLLVLLGACFGSVLWGGQQFSYRDAAHFYYPLYQRVQQEWDAHRWPLWEPEENGGTPLLGNPTAAVLYPGKIIYALFPYAWAARLYVVAHTILAFLGMLALMRSWGVSWIGSTIAALSYAFGAPILFQYCNIIFLVGAAWAPLGFRAIDRLVRLGRRWGLIELAVVLAMQTLGGDPQSAYLTGLCGAGYAIGPAIASRLFRRDRWWQVSLIAALVLVGWVAGTLAVAHWFFRHGAEWRAWRPSGQVIRIACWSLVGLLILLSGRWLWKQRRFAWGLVSLGCAGGLALGLASAQILPVLEFAGLSLRAAEEAPHDVFPFSLEPHRVIELIWPNVYGSTSHGNRSWLALVPPLHSPSIWIPSLYLGGLTLVLALAAFGFRNGPPWRAWLTAIAILSFVASLGMFTSPLWWARSVPVGQHYLGAHDPPPNYEPRKDTSLQDGDGSFYWLLATVLPGFGTFRYPSKLVSFTALALAALAGIGWDRLLTNGARRALVWASVLLAISLSGLSATLALRPQLIRAFELGRKSVGDSLFGPLNVPGSVHDLQVALAHGTVIFALVLPIILTARRRPRLAGALAIVVLTADLALANAKLVLTLPQSVFETEPRLLTLIQEAERANPSPGPYRVHRIPIWNPVGWYKASSSDRIKELVSWERDTLQPKYGIPYGLEYTITEGTTELYDAHWFFAGFYRHYYPKGAALPGAQPGQEIVVHPRRGFDLWNTRYFILPVFPNGWRDEMRGYASFLPETEPIAPKPSEFESTRGRDHWVDWVSTQDWQLLRNDAAFPRAWLVHSARFINPIKGLKKSDREKPMEEILYQNDPFWNAPDQSLYNPRRMAWVEVDDVSSLAGYLPGTPPDAAESVTITAYEPQRVALRAVLKRPGLVILADVDYPGWELTIDGVAAPILRTNRLMRGAAVKAGTHELVYTYWPASFRIGRTVSVASLILLVVLAAWATYRPVASGSFGLDPGGSPNLVRQDP